MEERRCLLKYDFPFLDVKEMATRKVLGAEQREVIRQAENWRMSKSSDLYNELVQELLCVFKNCLHVFAFFLNIKIYFTFTLLYTSVLKHYVGSFR
jgi:hypothetical protein